MSQANGYMSDSRISIVISVYNIKDYIYRCLYTVVNQTYRNLEIIVVDDGSNDGSELICDDFADKDDRIKVFHQHNQGVASTRNNGIRVATGEYIMFVDGDDYLHLEAVSILYDTISNDETCGIAMIDSIRTQSLKEDIESHWTRPIHFESLTQSQAISRLLATGYTEFSFMWNKLYRTMSVRDIDVHKYKTADDMDFNLRLFMKIDKIVWIHRPLYYYVQRSSSITKSLKSYLVPESVARVVADNLNTLDKSSIEYRGLLLKKLFRKLAEMSGRSWIANEYIEVRPIVSEYREAFLKEFLFHPRISVFEKLGINCLICFPILASMLLKVTRNV